MTALKRWCANYPALGFLGTSLGMVVTFHALNSKRPIVAAVEGIGASITLTVLLLLLCFSALVGSSRKGKSRLNGGGATERPR